MNHHDDGHCCLIKKIIGTVIAGYLTKSGKITIVTQKHWKELL